MPMSPFEFQCEMDFSMYFCGFFSIRNANGNLKFKNCISPQINRTSSIDLVDKGFFIFQLSYVGQLHHVWHGRHSRASATAAKHSTPPHLPNHAPLRPRPTSSCFFPEGICPSSGWPATLGEGGEGKGWGGEVLAPMRRFGMFP